MARRLGTAGYYVMLPNHVLPRRRHGARADQSRPGIAPQRKKHVRADALADDPAWSWKTHKALLAYAENPEGAANTRHYRHRRLLHERTLCGQCGDAFPRSVSRRQHRSTACSSRPTRTDSPHLAGQQDQGRTLFRVRRDRRLCAAGNRREGASEGMKRQPMNEVETLSRHPSRFCVPRSARIYDRDAAERHWERLLALYRRNLHTFRAIEGTRCRSSLIAFPVFNPIALQIGPIAIRWYALAYIGGIVLGWLYARALHQEGAAVGRPGADVAAADRRLHPVGHARNHPRRPHRLRAVLQSAVSSSHHPAEIFELWKGGMSFHGGFLGCVAAVMLFRLRKNDISILSLGDITTAVGPDRVVSRAASPTSSTASCGAGRRIPACRGQWYFPMAVRRSCRDIPASSMKRGIEGILLFTDPGNHDPDGRPETARPDPRQFHR